jgi:prolyl-tRNA synthetase
LVSSKGIEVGNIFDLSSRFTDAFGFTVTGEDGEKKTVYMGCYGIGVSRLVGAIVEACHDERGMIWPKSVAPAQVQLVMLNAKDAEAQDRVIQAAEELQEKLHSAGIDVLWDERSASVGEKLADADLIGLPLRLLISEKSMKEGSVEWKTRTEADAHLVKIEDVLEQVQAFLAE